MSQKSSRRDFLRGKSAADAVGDLADRGFDGGGALGPAFEPIGSSYLIKVSRRGMASQFEVFLNAGQYPDGTEAALAALDLVDELEEQMSVFRESSEISSINRTAATGPVEVEPRLFELLKLAGRLHDETDGALDITSGPLWKAWGFARREGAIPGEAELAEALQHVGGNLVELDDQNKTVHFCRTGVELNLGSIGKGYALDRLAESLEAAGVNDFLIHGGQSSVIARGSRMEDPRQPSDETRAGWTVGLHHPVRPGVRLAEIRLLDRALATSGSARQHFRYKGRRYGHILDPRTGWPAEGVLSATAISPSAAVADGLATAFNVLGTDRTLEYCDTRPEIAAVVVLSPKSGGDPELRSAGLSDDDLKVSTQW